VETEGPILMVDAQKNTNNIMKVCKNCFREFDEQEDDGHNPMVELGKIFLEHTTEVNPADYCLECREELGMLNVAGFEID
jgi:hypothetical protein